MSLIPFSPFGGLIPKTDPLMLPPNAAQVAINCRMSANVLEAYKQPLQIIPAGIGGVQTIYRFGQATNSDTQYWFAWSKDVNCVKGAIANDTEERTFFTGDGYPKVTTAALATSAQPYPGVSYHLGVPSPVSASVATASGAYSASAVAETRAYLYTFVSVLGEESPPSPVSSLLTIYPTQVAHLLMDSAPSGNFSLVSRRIYRTGTGNSGTDFLLVAEIPAATSVYDDNIAGSMLGNVCTSLKSSNIPPLARGLVSMPNGLMAAHTDYDVYFCDAYKPYSWPEGYIQTVDYPIVGLGAFGSSVAVLTQGYPYIITGTDPQSMSVEKLSVPYACLAKRSIVTAQGGVIYAAADGLVQISSRGPSVLTDELMTRREWSAYNPASMLCAIWDEKIFVFYDNGTQAGFILDLVTGMTDISLHATAAFTDPVTGSLFLAVNGQIVKWESGLAGTYRWKSSRKSSPVPKNFSFGQVLSDTYPVTFKVTADGVANEYTATSDNPFRLQSGFRARYWELEVSGTGRLFAAYLADSAAELQNV